MPAKLKNGVIGASGGKREGSGRRPDWLKEKCQHYLEKRELIKFVADVASGEPLQAFVATKDVGGKDVKAEMKVSADVKERLKAVEMLKEWGLGKETQPVDFGAGRRMVLIFPDDKDGNATGR